VNDIARDWQNLLPLPWDIADAAEDSTMLSGILMDSFEASFGMRPLEVIYDSFPNDLFAGVLIEGDPVNAHNVWGLLIGSRLHHAGVDITVVVRAASEFADR